MTIGINHFTEDRNILEISAAYFKNAFSFSHISIQVVATEEATDVSAIWGVRGNAMYAPYLRVILMQPHCNRVLYSAY